MDLERDILRHMEFRPGISEHLRQMDEALFAEPALGLRERLLATPLSQRFELDAEHRLLFVNFEGMAIQRQGDIEQIEQAVAELVGPLGEKVAAVVNYDNFTIAPDLLDTYASMVRRIAEQYYSRVTRYGTGGFLKAKLETRGVKPEP